MLSTRRLAARIRVILRPRGDAISPAPQSEPDTTPLSDRLRLLQWFRILAALAIVGVAVFTENPPAALVPLAVGYAALILALEMIRRRADPPAMRFVAQMAVVDAVVLAYATTMTGGPRSPLLFLMFLDVLAITLLLSYRTGLTIAVWSAVLLLAGHAAVQADLISSTQTSTDRDALLGALGFLVVALAAAAFSAVNERALRASRGHLAALVDLDAELGRTTTARDIVTTLARSATVDFDFSRAAVVVRHDDGWLRGVSGSDGIVEVVPCGPPTGLEATVAGEPTLVRALDPLGTLGAALPGAAAVVLVPVEVDEDVLGLLAAEWPRRRRRVPAVTIRSLARAAGHAALTLRHQALVAEVERLATHDPLTGLANRRSFEDVLDREIKRARRRSEPLTLAMVDIDHFKTVNDSFGHPTGDAVLRAIATALVVNTKSFDVVARLGGDEFALILPTCAAADAPGVAERLRRVCADAAATLDVTVSVGWGGCPDDGTDIVALVAAADSALYAAKRAGRNCVAAARQLDEATRSAATSRKRR